MSYESINKNRKATRNGGFFVKKNYKNFIFFQGCEVIIMLKWKKII